MLCLILRTEGGAERICFLLLKCLWKTLVWSPFIIFGLWLLNTPIVTVVPRVENGTLHGMYLQDLGEDAGTAITYNLSAVFRFHNPAINFKVSFDDNAAQSWYRGQKLGPDATLTSFQLPRGKTTMLPMDVQGQKVIGGKVATKYAEDATLGFFTIQVRLQAKEGDDTYTFLCTLQFPAPTAARGGPNLFDGDECMTVDVSYGKFFNFLRWII